MSDPVVGPVPVGQILGAEIEERGWTQADFAAVLGRPTQFVSEIITGKKEITRESAAQIGAALGTTPEYWLNLQDAYLLDEQATDAPSRQTQQAGSHIHADQARDHSGPHRRGARGRTQRTLRTQRHRRRTRIRPSGPAQQ